MKNSFLFSVGYPLGNTLNEGNSFYIERCDSMYNLSNTIIHYIWSKCMNGISYESLKESFDAVFDGEVQLDGYLQELIDNKFVLQINSEDNSLNYEIMKNFKLLRQGVGLGAINDSNSRYIHYSGEECEIEVLEYNVWLMANGNKTVSNIIDEFKVIMNLNEDDSIDIITAIVVLVGKGLIVILGELNGAKRFF